MSFTANSIEEAAHIDKGWVAKVFRKATEAEERVILMKKLIDQKLGVAEVEEFFGDLAENHRNTKYRSLRKSKLIELTMKDKLLDSLEERRVWRRQKASTIKKIHQVWGRKAMRTESLISAMVRSSRKLRRELRTKFDQKVRHMLKKFKLRQVGLSLPNEIARYSSVKCLQPDFIPSEPEANTQPLVFGDVHLDEDERSVMLLDHKYAVLDSLGAEEFELEVQAALAKLRWNRMKEDRQEENITEAESERLETLKAEARQIYDPKSKTVDYRKYRATDAPMNATLKLPPGQVPEYEAGLEVRFQRWMGTAKQYMDEFCDEKGRQEANLTSAQKRGLKKLKKRVAE